MSKQYGYLFLPSFFHPWRPVCNICVTRRGLLRLDIELDRAHIPRPYNSRPMHPPTAPNMLIRNRYKGCLRLCPMSKNRCFAIFLAGQKSRLFNCRLVELPRRSEEASEWFAVGNFFRQS